MALPTITPINELASAICVMGIVVLGMLIMVGAITVEQILERFGGLLMLIIGGFIALWMIKILVACLFVPMLASLKAALGWLALLLLAIIALAVVVRVTVSRTQN